MLIRASFDDSGTHSDSDVVIWGGVFGAFDNFVVLDRLWKQFLNSPVGDRRKLSKWHSRDCKFAMGEFFGWESGAIDLARRNARQCIIDSMVVPVSFAVPRKAWERIVAPSAPDSLKDPGAVAFSKCGDSALQLAHRRREPIICVYDLGQKNGNLDDILGLHAERAKELKVEISQTFKPVADNYGLQAADFIVTETYWVAKEVVNGRHVSLDAHQTAFFGRTEPISLIMTEDEMVDLANRWSKIEFSRRPPQ